MVLKLILLSSAISLLLLFYVQVRQVVIGKEIKKQGLYLKVKADSASSKLNKQSEPVISEYESFFSDKLFKMSKDGRKVLDYPKIGKYDLIGNSISKSERYNHFCP